MILRLAAICLLLAPAPALGWWEYGHATVARIALDEASPRARARTLRMLARSYLLETPNCPAVRIERAAYWADCILRLRDRFSYSAPWHYQNISICSAFDIRANCPNGQCVTAQIERHTRLLAEPDLPERERIAALLFLIHFVGDLHQPLHVGDRSDRGGNALSASYGIIAGRTNLHMIWDGYLAERAISTPPGGAHGLTFGLSRADKAVIRAGTVTSWAEESWALSRGVAYPDMLADPCAPDPPAVGAWAGGEDNADGPRAGGEDNTDGPRAGGEADHRPVLDEREVQEAIPLVRLQVMRGGLRLARLLDEALG